jgi:hypothetical protein
MNSKQNGRWFEKHPAIVFSLFIVGGILAIDFVCSVFIIPEDYNSFRAPNPNYHHDLLANQESKNIWGDRIFNIYTNSLGFKDKSCRKVTLTTDKKRILFIGDSFTESMGMTWEESFIGVLSEKLKEVEILNAGVVSYSPKLYYLKVKYLLEYVRLKFDELYVFIDNSDPLNEITYQDFEPYDKNAMKKFGYIVNRFLFTHSYLYYSISGKITSNRKSRVTESWNPVSGQSVLDEFSKEDANFIAATLNWSYSPDIFEKWGKKGLQLAAENMQKLCDKCNQNNIKVTVVIYPWPSMIVNKDINNVQVIFWDNFCQKNNLRFLNLYPKFISGEDPKEVIRKYFITGDVHWSEEGNRHVADILKNYIYNQ